MIIKVCLKKIPLHHVCNSTLMQKQEKARKWTPDLREEIPVSLPNNQGNGKRRL